VLVAYGALFTKQPKFSKESASCSTCQVAVRTGPLSADKCGLAIDRQGVKSEATVFVTFSCLTYCG
jgi:ferredoxin